MAALALILYACSGSGSKKQQSAGDGRSSGPVASSSSTPTAGGTSSSAAATGGASGSASSSSAGGPTGGATGSASVPGGASGSGPGGGTGGTGGATGTGGSGCQLSLSLTSQDAAYANGVDPQFTVAVVNKGTADCDVDVSPKSLVLSIYSGQDRVWTSADCATGGKDTRGIAPGGVQTVTYTWNRTRSSQGCTPGGSSAALGTYYGVVSLGPGSGPNAPSAQSQPKTFELKTGS